MNPVERIALIAVTKRGLTHACLLRKRLRQGDVYCPKNEKNIEHGPAIYLDRPLAACVPALFERYDQLVFFLATGAVTRLIAPSLTSKQNDPGVLAIDEGCRFVVPLLSGHEGGANAFARRVAGCLGATPVITTASESAVGFCLELLESEFGWTSEPNGRYKPVTMALLNGDPVALIQEIGCAGQWLDNATLPPNVVGARSAATLPDQHFEWLIWITDRIVDPPPRFSPERIIWYRPKSLVLGSGSERGISLDAYQDGIDRFLLAHHYSPLSIDTLTSVTLKADEDAMITLADGHGWKRVYFSADELSKVSGIPNPSAIVDQCVGTPGVAEPAAILASQANGLLVEKQVLASTLAPQRMTFALARHAKYQAGSVRSGKVIFIGAGPGDPDLLTIKASHALQKADVVIYAGSLIPERVLRAAPAESPRHDSAYLTLEEVLRLMTTAVGEGKTVARLHSGDTSLYSAMQEQLAALDEVNIDYEVIPGISAYQAAAARLACELTIPEVVQTVILTRGEGETPMPDRESLQALAQHGASLCLFLSARLGETVQQALLSTYPPETPVVLLYRVTWPDEKIIQTDLAGLSEALREHHLVRTTLILVGPALGPRKNRSRLYDQIHGHIFRPRKRHENRPAT